MESDGVPVSKSKETVKGVAALTNVAVAAAIETKTAKKAVAANTRLTA